MAKTLDHLQTLQNLYTEKGAKLLELPAALEDALAALHADDREGIMKGMPAQESEEDTDKIMQWTKRFQALMATYEEQRQSVLAFPAGHPVSTEEVQLLYKHLEALNVHLQNLYSGIFAYGDGLYSAYSKANAALAGTDPDAFNAGKKVLAADPEAFGACKTAQKEVKAAVNNLIGPLKKTLGYLEKEQADIAARKPAAAKKEPMGPERLFFIGSALEDCSDIYTSTLRNFVMEEWLQQLHEKLNYADPNRKDLPGIYRLGSQTIGEAHSSSIYPIKHAHDLDLSNIEQDYSEEILDVSQKTVDKFTAAEDEPARKLLACGFGTHAQFPEEFRAHRLKKAVNQQHITLRCNITPEMLKSIPSSRGTEVDRLVMTMLVDKTGEHWRFRENVVEHINKNYEESLKGVHYIHLTDEEKTSLRATPECIPVLLSVECLHGAPRPIFHPSLSAQHSTLVSQRSDYSIRTVKPDHFVPRASPFTEIANKFSYLASRVGEMEDPNRISSKLGCSLIDFYLRYQMQYSSLNAGQHRGMDHLLRSAFVLQLPFQRNFYEAKTLDEAIPQRLPHIPLEKMAEAVKHDCAELYYGIPGALEQKIMKNVAKHVAPINEGVLPHNTCRITDDGYDELLSDAVEFFKRRYEEVCLNLTPEERCYLELAHACRDNPQGMRSHPDEIWAVMARVGTNNIQNLKNNIWTLRNTPRQEWGVAELKEDLAKLVSSYIEYTVKSWEAQKVSPPRRAQPAAGGGLK